jgi:hypothetical protein
MASTNDKKKEHFTLLEDVKDKLSNPLVIGGILVIIILIVVAVMMWKKQSGVESLTETATKYLLTNTPELEGYN